MKHVNEVRAGFLDFFARNGHETVASSSLMPHNDPTLMFANAGMNQFKNAFTGTETLPYSRATSSQKCVRAGGKHNDLDNVGYTRRHHTFFEMLGNFSFGDYFKEDAIALAWELLTKDYGLDKNKLSFTVYHTDDEAFDLWKKITGCGDGRILRIPTKDNFWAMGDTGPCGPCSEIFYDHGDGGGSWSLDADGNDQFGERFVEIWNLVFMQYEQIDADTRRDLPKPSIDTGMGLERISAVLQGVHDNYEIDLFADFIRDIKNEAGKLGGTNDLGEAPYKVLADHMRSSCFLMADGVLPSNEGRGYVLRRIMRRAMRYAHQLGCSEPLMYRLVPALNAQMAQHYPELQRANAVITEQLKQEEERFKQTLERGLKLLDEESAKLSTGQKLSGDAAFKLYDTFGFPLDLTQDILRSRDIGVDIAGFETCMEGQRSMARAAWSGAGGASVGKLWFDIKEQVGTTQFTGYNSDVSDAKILAIVKDAASVDSAKAGDEVYIVLDSTPFYGESGGQVGDKGTLLAGNHAIARISDTQKPIEHFHVHQATLCADVSIGDSVVAQIDVRQRDYTRANHSATHLLHKALRDALGDHVTQKGSLVDAERLRFDFSHAKGMSPDEIAAVEARVNAMVVKNTPVDTKESTPDEAIEAGAMALFGEKYGDTVRVLSMGDDDGKAYSVELCGGTHVRSTGDIGLFKITSEGSVASGVRRVEAVTGDAVREHCAQELTRLRETLTRLWDENAQLRTQVNDAGGTAANAAGPLAPLALEPLSNVSADALLDLYDGLLSQEQTAIDNMIDANKKLTKELAKLKSAQAMEAGSDVEKDMIGAVGYIGKVFDGVEAKELRGLADSLLKKAEPGVVALITTAGGKASLVVAVSNGLNETIAAPELVKLGVETLGGKGGGGRPNMAQGGGPDINKADEALQKIATYIKEHS